MNRQQVNLSDESLAKKCIILSEKTFSTGSPWNEKQFLSSLTNEVYKKYFLFDEDNLIGFVLFSVVFDEADLLLIGVDPEFQGQAIGYQLLQEAQKELQEITVKKIFLEVRRSNVKAIKFYQKNNFEEIGVRNNYYQNPKEDALIWMLEL